MANFVDLKFITDDSQLDKSIKKLGSVKSQINSLVAAEKTGQITTEQFNKRVSTLATEFQKAAGGSISARNAIFKYSREVYQATQANKTLATAVTQANAAITTKTKGMSRFGVVSQQAGYQFSDFIVQVQSGQSAFVAFSQQATQLVGVLPLLFASASTGLIAFTAGLSIVIPLMSALGNVFYTSRNSADQTGSSVSSLAEAMEVLEKKIRDVKESDLRKALGLTSEQAAAKSQIEKQREEVERLRAELVKAQRETENISVPMGSLLMLAPGMLEAQSRALVKQADARRAVAEATQALANAEATLQEDLDRQTAEALDERTAKQEDYVNSLKQELNFQNSIFGKTSEEIEIQNRLRRVHNELLEQGLTPSDNLYLKAIQYTQQTITSEKMVKSMADKIREAAAAQEDLSSFSGTYEQQITIINAQIEALKNGKNSESAAFIEGERMKVQAVYETSKALAIQTGDVAALAATTLNFLDAMAALEDLSAARENLSSARSSFRGGGGGSSNRDPLADLIKRINLEKDLLGVSDARRQVLKAIANADQNYTQGAINNAIKLVEQYEAKKDSLDALKETFKSINSTIESSMENGFMAMVEGTKSVKDAFKDMARDIIRELYRVLVVKRMVGSVGGGTGLAGMLGGGLSFNPFGGISFDGGGYTGSGPRSGGMDGRGGFLAMMHPNETVVDHTKAGSSTEGNVTVVQNFHFQANGDESVKKLIAQAAPSIASMAKQSVVDARRRGGAMKNAFG